GGEAAEWLGVAGRLPGLLELAGVRVAEVDAVVLTHVHLDHVGWSAEGELPRFPNAEYVVQADELAHVRGGATYERMIRPIERAGQLRVVEGDVGFRGTRLVPTPGHTPGHQSVLTERALLGGDVLVHPAQARWPELTYVYERDPAQAVTSRREMLALAAATGVPIAASHPHPAFDAEARALTTPTSGETVCPPWRL
ncbi:MBL fold metallo-hydrolase, partial [Kribbella antibiotica]